MRKFARSQWGPRPTDQRLALEHAGVVVVQLDARLVGVHALGDHAVAREGAIERIGVDVRGQARQVDARVLPRRRLLLVGSRRRSWMR